MVLLDEIVISTFSAINFPPFCPFFEELNRKIDRMISSGILVYWYNNYHRIGYPKKVVDEVGPEVLTMEHLEIGFVVCLIPLGLSILVFLCELLIFHGKILIQKVISN